MKQYEQVLKSMLDNLNDISIKNHNDSNQLKNEIKNILTTTVKMFNIDEINRKDAMVLMNTVSIIDDIFFNKSNKFIDEVSSDRINKNEVIITIPEVIINYVLENGFSNEGSSKLISNQLNRYVF